MYTATGQVDIEQRIAEFAPLVRRMAHHLAAKLPSSVEVDDIIQAGLIGLMDAAGRFEASQGNQFETYASQRIRGAMLDELRRNDWLPRSIRKAYRQIEQAIGRLEQRLGHPPDEREIAAEMGLSLSDYQAMLSEARGYQLFHFEDFDTESDGSMLDRLAADHDHNPLDKITDKRFRAALVKAIQLLPEREQHLMGMYYEQEMNFKEIAAVMKVSESRVCQLHGQAVARLRARLKDW
ncbi:MAG: RNA polymerase sigma factor FliA [Burkholderiales bacterium]